MKRYVELDSLRGIVALCVIFYHFVFIMSEVPDWIQFVNITPLRFLRGGHEAVIFFFVLSGFVLSLPFLKQTRKKYISFLTARVFRIYVPYISILILALLLYYATYSASMINNHWWSTPITMGELFRQLLLVPEFNDSAINPVVWSLTQEMRISIIFPLIIIAIMKFRWYINITLGVFLSVLSLALNYFFPSTYLNPISTNYFYTLHYIGMFIVGALLALNKDKIVNSIKSSTRAHKYLLLLAGIIFYSYSGGIDKVLKKIFSSNQGLPWMNLIADWGITLGVALIIISALSIVKLSNILKLRPFTFLGDISYSLYLVHAVILLSFIHLFQNSVALWQLELLVLIVVIPVAYLCYLFIELPSKRFGKILVQKFENAQLESSVSSSPEIKTNINS
ncbi:acyltransferase [Paenibacillus sp. ISL-20]|uniref:acyltransferase family protein n=1 Tax=Paenibacillus sp. ISL-20 TaxID=2819163 RepID=UPI001BEC7B45|nr:acyltransferase [Paenibacillus sp. ISL-20]MBT2759839.1 acyltransferase [Paenibacillus sp. ISL-20]